MLPLSPDAVLDSFPKTTLATLELLRGARPHFAPLEPINVYSVPKRQDRHGVVYVGTAEMYCNWLGGHVPPLQSKPHGSHGSSHRHAY